jgi:hypothetical protein
MMEKIIDVGSWDRMADCCVEFVKVSSRGLIGWDRHEFIEKRAGHHSFVDAIDSGLLKLAAGDLPIHILAVGATEGYGFNRNGDGFNESICISQHPTFAKMAKYFRHHRNKLERGDPFYGAVKLAAYNRDMRRIECLTIGNMDKAAAFRNGGLMMLPETLARIERGDDVAWSMACKVANDVCAICHNKAAHRAEYCTEDTCIDEHGKRGLGCRHNMTKLCEDGRQQGVENPDAIFFDLSEVGRPADRGAYGWKADYLQKAASTGHMIGGAELAELYAAENGYTLLDPTVNGQRKHAAALVGLAYKLASLEHQIEANPTHRDMATACAFAPAMQPPMDLGPLGTPGTRKLATALSALAGQKIAMPVRDFVRLVASGDAVKAAAWQESVPGRLPGVYGRLIVDGSLEQSLVSNAFAPSPELASAEQRSWAKQASQHYSLDETAIQERVVRSALRSLPIPAFRNAEGVKAAANDPGAEHIARQFALYKLAFLGAHVGSPGFDNLCESVVLQNYVS